MNWSVYIILCTDDSLYTGVTTDMSRRYQQHAQGKGAKYFYGRKPKELVFLENGHSKRTACQREAAIKKLPKLKKLELIDLAKPLEFK